MLLHNSHGGQLSFFEIAATLIPILVFSGVVAERNGPQPQDSHRRSKYFAVTIPVIGALAVLAELVSISAIIVGPVSGSAIGFVATCLAGGLVAVILSVWLPWLSAFRKRMPDQYPTVLGLSITLLVGVSIFTVVVVIQAVGAAHSLERTEARVRSCERRITAAENQIQQTFHEQDANQAQVRADIRNSAEANEHLYRAEDEHSPSRLLKLLKARAKEEGDLYVQDLKQSVRFARQQGGLFKELDTATRCASNREPEGSSCSPAVALLIASMDCLLPT